MSQQRRAGRLAKAAGIGYQKALGHLKELALPLGTEKSYVQALESHGRAAEDACERGHEYYAPVGIDGKFAQQPRRFMVGWDGREGGPAYDSTWCPVCDRINEMTDWFLTNYKDPADGVPHDSREGGYQYVNGGPYEPTWEIQENFPDVTRPMLEAAVEQISGLGWEWVKNEEY